MLTNYVLVLANTGIRVGEARNLNWSDIDTFVGDDDKENIVLQVRGKTGAREVVARTLAVKDYLQRIWELRCDELQAKPAMSEGIFCHKDGKPIHSFKKGFNALIKEAVSSLTLTDTDGCSTHFVTPTLPSDSTRVSITSLSQEIWALQ